LSCDRSGRRCANASKRNGLSGQVSRYLNTVGSWSTYRDLGGVEEAPERLAEVTAAFFGLKGLLAGRPQLTGLLGLIIGLHALEQITGSTITFGMRLLARGRPLYQPYRGITLRQSPFTPRVARLVNRLSHGRVSDSQGYYFFQGGRTWHYQSLTLELAAETRTLTVLRSFSIPHREFFFDRAIPPDDSINLALGDRDPDTIPGYIGSVNEFEDATGAIGNLKRVFFMANWLLVDPGERDSGGGVAADIVDYDALVKGLPPGGQEQGQKINIRTAPRSGPVYSTGSRPYPSTTPVRSGPGSTLRPMTSPPQAIRPAEQAPYGATLFAPGDRPARQTVEVDGQVRPLVIRRLMTDPLSGRRRAEAAYYDEALGQWRLIDDNSAREQLAAQVEAGQLALDPSGAWPF
jgi:hypothetical protein